MNERNQEDIIKIDFVALFEVLWNGKWLILGVTTLFTLAGFWYAFTAREEFVSEGKILPEVSAGSGSSLGGLADLVGIGGFEMGLNNNTEAIRPDLYPDVIATAPFCIELLKQTFQTKTGDSVIFENYFHRYIEEGKIPNESKIETFSAKPNGVIVISRLTQDRIKELKERIIGSIDKKSGIISISSKMPDPVIAAQVTKFAMTYLTNYVGDYRTEKLKQEVDFLGRKVASARGDFYKDQERKASYADRFSAPTMRLQSADIQRERLESEYKLSSTVYNELLKKFEEAKIKLHQETPVFQILDPPSASNMKIEPRKGAIILVIFTLGLLFSIVFILFYKKNYKKILKNEFGKYSN